jgi:diacylglycerol kinase family enzyme
MGMQIAPSAKVDDGLLEACVVGDRAVWKRFRDARHLALGSVERAPGILFRPVRTASIEMDGEIEYHVDGECGVANGWLDVGVRPGALRVRVPL